MKQRELFTRLWAKQNKKPYGYFLILLFFASFLNMQNIYSQNKTVTGTVIDESGIPLPGASVSNKDTGNGTQTDFDGKYSISVKDDNATLVFSFLGFTTVEQSGNGKSVLSVTRKEDAESIKEI